MDWLSVVCNLGNLVILGGGSDWRGGGYCGWMAGGLHSSNWLFGVLDGERDAAREERCNEGFFGGR